MDTDGCVYQFTSTTFSEFFFFSDFNVIILVTFPQMNVRACARVCKIYEIYTMQIVTSFF